MCFRPTKTGRDRDLDRAVLRLSPKQWMKRDLRRFLP
jgi:hypothetical protein